MECLPDSVDENLRLVDIASDADLHDHDLHAGGHGLLRRSLDGETGSSEGRDGGGGPLRRRGHARQPVRESTGSVVHRLRCHRGDRDRPWLHCARGHPAQVVPGQARPGDRHGGHRFRRRGPDHGPRRDDPDPVDRCPEDIPDPGLRLPHRRRGGRLGHEKPSGWMEAVRLGAHEGPNRSTGAEGLRTQGGGQGLAVVRAVGALVPERNCRHRCPLPGSSHGPGDYRSNGARGRGTRRHLRDRQWPRASRVGVAFGPRGRKWVFLIMYLLQAVLFFSLTLTNSFVVFTALGFVILLCYGGGFGTMPAFTADYFGSKRVGPIYGLMLTAWGAASVLGPLLIAYIRETTGTYTNALYIIGGILLAGAVIPVIVRPPKLGTKTAAAGVDPSSAAGGMPR